MDNALASGSQGLMRLGLDLAGGSFHHFTVSHCKSARCAACLHDHDMRLRGGKAKRVGYSQNGVMVRALWGLPSGRLLKRWNSCDELNVWVLD